MLKFITIKSVTVAAAAIVAVGMATFFILAPPAKAQPQVLSADVEHALAKGDRLRPLVKGAACSARSWPNYDKSCQFDLHVGRSGPPGAGARFGEGWQRSTSSSPHAEQSWTRCAFFPRGANIIAMIAHGVLLDRYKLLRYSPQQ